MSLRKLKIKLWYEDNKCYYCQKPTVITNISHGTLPPDSATIEHCVSRLNPHRWLRKKSGHRRKVLACYKCNQDRSKLETLCLSRAEILQRSRGFSLSPKGKPPIIKPLNTLDEVFAKLGL